MDEAAKGCLASFLSWAIASIAYAVVGLAISGFMLILLSLASLFK